VTHYYAVAKFVNGGYVFSVMTPAEITRHAKKNSPSYGSQKSPWTKHFDAMAKKTVIRQICKYLPKTVELTKAISHDEGVHKEIPEDGDILDVTPIYNQPKLEGETVEAEGNVVDGEVRG
jgi:recombination protein RecT